MARNEQEKLSQERESLSECSDLSPDSIGTRFIASAQFIAPPSEDLDAPPLGDLDAPPSGDLDAPPLGDLDAPPSGDLDAPPSGDLDAPPRVAPVADVGVIVSADGNQGQPRVLVTMGSDSDLPLMMKAIDTLRYDFGITCLVQINSVHRDLRTMIQHIDNLPDSVQVIIACAGGAAHLPGNIADLRADLPVIGVPRDLGALKGIDALLSMVQMPEGAPVAVMAIGEAGAVNAAIHAAKELAIADPVLKERLRAYAAKRKDRVLKQNEGLEKKFGR